MSKSNYGWSPLHLAAYFGHYQVAKLLLENGADVNDVNTNGDTALHKAAFSNRVDVVTLLINHSADVSMINSEGNVPKQITRNPDIRKILEAVADVDRMKGEENFLAACRNGALETLTKMLSDSKFPNFNCTDEYGNTGLHLASYRGHKEIAVLLLQNGIDSTIKNSRGQMALEMARSDKMKQILDVKPVKELQRRVQRYEAPLYKKSKIFGWRGFWVVLERGVMSYYGSRADGSTGTRRKNFKYLDDAVITPHRKDRDAFTIKFSDETSHILSLGEHCDQPELSKQKWWNAFREHIDYSTYYTKCGSNYDDDDIADLLPLGSMQDVLKSAQANQQVLEKQMADVTSQIHSMSETPNAKVTSVGLLQVRQKFSDVAQTSRDMCADLSHCMTLFTQQEEVRKAQLQQEQEKSRVLQDVVHRLATEYHEMEQSLSVSGNGGAGGVRSPARFYDTDDDEFYDCDENENNNETDGANDISVVEATKKSTPRFRGNAELIDSENYSFYECASTEESKPSSANNGNLVHSMTSRNEKSKWGARTSLPVPMFSRNDFSVWSILKKCIGKELSKITMPVIFNEPLSFLQRITEYLEYAKLLKQANDCDDPVERMEIVSAFAVSASASNWDRLGKPFNPLLGETYEMLRDDLGFRIVCEQVSHHPPVSAFHVESSYYRFHGAIQPKLKFWGKSVEVQPKGTVTLELLRHGEVYTWHNINCSVHNIIVGKLWVEHHGVMEITNHTNDMQAVLNFKPCGWFGKDLHKIEGFIYNKNKTKLKALYGKWIEALYSVSVESSNGDMMGDEDNLPPMTGSSCDLDLPTQRCLWQADQRPDNSAHNYSMTLFALMLNEKSDDSLKLGLPPTDSRFRPDMRKLEEGDLDGAAEEKMRLEEKQRGARKDRKRRKNEWTPRWFDPETNPHTSKEDWVFNGRYWNRDWSESPDIF
ncbi:oxysterol-binding protein-related protein 1-like isoform X2 [Tubulanus polymorphus]|uniref:oxysterol-binding protein-related protein 1-like isoform X2 n=1 Tax=Tubulanus polymorphus TaxID=672921 RepID=UPI003DA3179F